MQVAYERGSWVRVERQCEIFRLEDGMRVALYDGYVNYRAREVRCYIRKQLLRGWRGPGLVVVPFGQIKGM